MSAGSPQGVSQRHDLCEVLINLLPYCLHMKPTSSTEDIDLFPGDSGRRDDGSGNPSLEQLQEWLNGTHLCRFLLLNTSLFKKK